MPPPRPRLLLVLVPLALLLLGLMWARPARAAAGERWRWPVRGEVVAGFRYAPGHPFDAGHRRGIDIAAAPGVTVRSACRGRVAYAGPVPGRGLGVTVRCGALVATHLGLGRVAVRRGARVRAGSRLGAVGPGGRVRLGARRSAARFGYVDPTRLLAAAPAEPRGPAALPLGRAPRAPRSAPPLARHAVPRPRPGFTGARAVPAVPALAWAGLVLVAAGVPLGRVVHRGRRRRRAAGTVPVPGR